MKMKKLTLFSLAALAVSLLVSCGKDDDTDMKCSVAVVDAEIATVGFSATLDQSEIVDGARFDIMSSTVGDPADPSNKQDVDIWKRSSANDESKVDALRAGHNWYDGFYSKDLTPGSTYYIRIKFTTTVGGKTIERVGPMSKFYMPNPGDPYVGSSSLTDITSSSAKVHAVWMSNGQSIASVGYLISDDEKDIEENKGTLVTLDSPEVYDFEFTGLDPQKSYYTKLWCQTKMPENPTKYHVAQRFYSNKVTFVTTAEAK